MIWRLNVNWSRLCDVYGLPTLFSYLLTNRHSNPLDDTTELTFCDPRVSSVLLSGRYDKTSTVHNHQYYGFVLRADNVRVVCIRFDSVCVSTLTILIVRTPPSHRSSVSVAFDDGSSENREQRYKLQRWTAGTRPRRRWPARVPCRRPPYTTHNGVTTRK